MGKRFVYMILSFLMLLFLSGETLSKGVITKLSVPFVKNEGQMDERVEFYANILGGTLYVTRDGELIYNLPKIENGRIRGGVIVKEVLKGAKVKKVFGLEKTKTKVNYFIGKDEKRWRRNIETFKTVSLGEVYKGISVRLRAYYKNVEKIFEVKPGADPGNITIKVKGIKELRIDSETGELVLETDLGEVRFTKPVAYQEVDGKRVEISVRYKLVSKDAYGFELGKYDRSRPLVIDPLLASTFLGGQASEVIWPGGAMAIDQSGNIYITGRTYSIDFPVTPGAFKDTLPENGNADAFVAKISGDLTTLLSATFLGGSGHDEGFSVALDQNGNVFVAGVTGSNDFPVTQDAYQGVYRGGGTFGEAFIAKFSNDLTTLLASTYLGGTDDETATSIVVDQNGNVYVTGNTISQDFPTTTGAYDTDGGRFISGWDVFVSMLSNDLQNLLASTYLGGTSRERAYSMALDQNGNVFIVGGTYSDDFPITPDAYQNTFTYVSADYPEAFIAKLSGDLKKLLASTYLGGTTGLDVARTIAIDQSGNVYVAGETGSSDFPTTQGAYQSNTNGGVEAFISKLDNNLTNLLASTYLGGGCDFTFCSDKAISIAIDQSGDVFVAGLTNTSSFPTTEGAFQSHLHNSVDAFVSRLSGDLTTLIASTYLGGSGGFGDNDSAYAIALDQSGNVYVAGITDSSDFPTTPGVFQPAYNGGGDIYISKLTPDLSNAIPSIDSFTVNPTNGSAPLTVTFDWSVSDQDGDNLVCFLDIDNDGNDDYVITDCANNTSHQHTYTTPGNYIVKLTVKDSWGPFHFRGGETIQTVSVDVINDPPTIDSFTVNPSSGNAPLTVTFSWGVSDPNGDTLICYLDVNNDGNVEYTINDCANYTSKNHTYYTAGNYTAKLTVDDGNGGTVFRTVDISVTNPAPSNNPPVIRSFTANPTSGGAPLTVTFSWTVSDQDGDVLTCYLDVNNDGNTDYTINDCVNNTSQQHTYKDAGNYTARFTVDDGNGGVVFETVNINVTWVSESAPGEGAKEGESEEVRIPEEGTMEGGGEANFIGCNSFHGTSVFMLFIVPVLIFARRFTRK